MLLLALLAFAVGGAQTLGGAQTGTVRNAADGRSLLGALVRADTKTMVVSFRGGLNAPPSEPHGVFTAPSSSGSYTTVAQEGGQFADAFGETSVNASGQVAFWAVLTNSTEGIFVGTGGATTIAITEAGLPVVRLFEFPKCSMRHKTLEVAEVLKLDC